MEKSIQEKLGGEVNELEEAIREESEWLSSNEDAAVE